VLERIEQVLDERVRPLLQLHGGEIQVEEFDAESGTLYFRLTGQCAGCPSADLTTETIVESELRAAIPEIRQVVLDQQVSEELLEQARKILRHEM
jgi:Fe-S cluster biogenesis protein NfuA